MVDDNSDADYADAGGSGCGGGFGQGYEDDAALLSVSLFPVR